jgi:AraC-like DNA-binding protein
MIASRAGASRRMAAAEAGPTIGAYVAHDRARDLLKRAFPRRRGRLTFCRSAAELSRLFSKTLVDIVIVDVGGANDDTWKAASLAAEFPCTPFFGFVALRVADAPTVARCASLDFVDVIVDGMDDGVMRDLVLPDSFSVRFAAALGPAHSTLGLGSTVQRKAWDWIVGRGGRPVRTDLLARELGVTREHLSRSFATAGAPNLKRVIDLVRVIAAAELCKCPGYDVNDVARVLEYASPSHLTTTAQRVCGTRSASLARLRAGDIIERFQQYGRTRSRAKPA